MARDIRIYQAGEYQSGQLLDLSPEAGQHLAVVLRLQPGDCFTLFNGANCEFEACIDTVKKKQVRVSIGLAKNKSLESSLSIHLAQGIAKGDRMELVMQKAVELGVASITPLITSRCAVKLDKERMAKKLQQWQGIVIAACEQSGRNLIPPVYAPVAIEQWLPNVWTQLRLILHPGSAQSWRDYSIKDVDVSLIIGPEGGLTEEEINLAASFQFSPLSLGPRILRTETAAICALSVLQAVGGDL